MNVTDDWLNSLVFFIRHDHHDIITETESLSFISLFIGSPFSLARFDLSAMTSEKILIFEKSRHVSLSAFYIGFPESRSSLGHVHIYLLQIEYIIEVPIINHYHFGSSRVSPPPDYCEKSSPQTFTLTKFDVHNIFNDL